MISNWLERNNINPMWKVVNKEVDLGEPTSFFNHKNFRVFQCEISKDIVDNIEPCLNPEFPQDQLKKYHAWKICVSLRGPTTWKVMPRNVWNDIVHWQTRRLNNSTQYQSINSMHWWPSFQRRLQIRERVVKSMLSNCSEMLILGTCWKTWYSVVSEQTCKIDEEMVQSLWQTIKSFDILHSSYMWLHKVLLCG